MGYKNGVGKKHEVTLYVRNLNKVTINDELLQVIQGDINDKKLITKVLQGQECVNR